ncbi:MAG TPA: hypothetical protein VG122_05760 [Gemmata sp.]|jgi:hypothetical protein|nr:hypothetical protein [Gemmata sp.]
MSNPSIPGTSVVTPARPDRRALLAVLVLTPLASVTLSVLLVLSILHFLARVPNSAVANGTLADPRLLHDFVEPFTQTGRVSVTTHTDVVFYPVPYASPPHLTLTSKAEDRSFVILRQDEYGFVWALTAGLKDVKDLAGKVKDVKDLQGAGNALAGLSELGAPALRPGDELNWESRGVRPFSVQSAPPPFIQKGILSIPGRDINNQATVTYEQVEFFPHPFASPPNVTVDLAYQSGQWDTTNVKILASTPTGFKWQSVNGTNPGMPLKASWTAKGVPATKEQVDEFGRNPPQFDKEQVSVVTDKGKLTYAPGEEGVQSFSQPFAAPPNVEVSSVIVTEITSRGFKWKETHSKNPLAIPAETHWTARGVPDLAVNKPAEKK